jgi:hypothetical protein
MKIRKNTILEIRKFFLLLKRQRSFFTLLPKHRKSCQQVIENHSE